MTTPAAERLYLAQHELAMEGKCPAVYNPLNEPHSDLPIIFGFNNGGSNRWYHAVLIAEDGECLGGHVCSAEGYMPHDLGILEGTREDFHETFREHYPNGYRMEFVPSDQLPNHERFNAALKLANEKTKLRNED